MLPKDPNQNMIEKLGSQNIPEAFRAISNLKDQGAQALPYLMKAIRREEESTRVMAVVVLGELETAAVPAIPVLLDLLKEENDQMRMAAALALVRIGDKSIHPIREYIASADDEDCFWASWSLALLNSPLEEKAVAALYKAHKDSTNPIEMIAAEEALGKVIGNQLKQ